MYMKDVITKMKRFAVCYNVYLKKKCIYIIQDVPLYTYIYSYISLVRLYLVLVYF